MLAPTPLLKPGPLDIGGLFAGSFDVLKRQFGLLVLVTVLPGLLILVALAVSGAILWPSLGALFGGATGQTGGPTTGVVAGGVVLFVGVLLGMLAQLKSYGMLSLAAYEIDAQVLRWAEYLPFVDAGGLDDERLFSPAGWRWRQGQGQEGRNQDRPRH